MKIRLVGAELCIRTQSEGETDVTKLIVAFRNYANAPKKGEGIVAFPRPQWLLDRVTMLHCMYIVFFV